MRTFTTHLQAIILMVLFAFATVQNANASAKAGEASVYEGGTVTIKLADAYERTLRKSTGVTYQWYSENNSYATVTSSTRYYATVKGIKATSSCKVYFKCSYFIDGFFRTMDFYYTITVKSTNVSVTNVMLNQSSISLKKGNSYQLSASIYPTNATNKYVNWSSNNTSVATVNNGLVSAKSVGTATITCRAADGSGKYATCKVYVEAATVYVTSITLNKTAATLYVGETTQLHATVSPSSATNKSVGWTSDDTSVATVSSTGLVTAKSAGTATIKCKAKDGSGKQATCNITVKKNAIGKPTVWSGNYKVASNHVENNPTRVYQDGFEMTIAEKDGSYYITSMFNDDLTKYNNGGFKLHDSENGTATVDVSYYNILRYTDNNSPLYTLYVFDEATDDWADTWTLKMNEDGSITLGAFYVAAFSWNESEEKWKNGQLEALYYSLKATVEDITGISNTVVETPKVHIANGSITLDDIANITVYRDNGMIVFSGKTNRVGNLAKGLYIVRIGSQSKKILIK